MSLVKGRVHSIQSLGTLDGPGVRFVVFLQGCPLRCGCCHNPDTWAFDGGSEYSAIEIVEKAMRYREYFGEDGGITLSGGEPLMQAEFVKEIFTLAKERGLNTCLDTSGCVLNDKVKELLRFTDRVLLDIKYTDEKLYKKYVGCEYRAVKEFLSYLNEKMIKTTFRQVVIPTLNDDEENAKRLKKLMTEHECVDKIELLPFKKICQVKYDALKIKFPFENFLTPNKETMQKLNSLIKD